MIVYNNNALTDDKKSLSSYGIKEGDVVKIAGKAECKQCYKVLSVTGFSPTNKFFQIELLHKLQALRFQASISVQFKCLKHKAQVAEMRLR